MTMLLRGYIMHDIWMDCKAGKMVGLRFKKNLAFICF